MLPKSFFLKLFLMSFFLIFSLSLNYDDQAAWRGYCNYGKKQSPINITPSSLSCSDYNTFSLKFNDQAKISFAFDETSKEWNKNIIDNYGSFEAEDVDGVVQAYKADGATLHVFGEHLIDDQRPQAELQLKFKVDQTKSRILTHQKFAIISIPLNKTKAEEGTKGFLEALDLFTVEENDQKILSIKMNELIGKVTIVPRNFIMYQGSLTTPDCEETVNWYVMDSPIIIRDDELDFLLARGPNAQKNYRDIQPLNGRYVQKICNVTSRIRTLFQNPAFYFLTVLILAGYLVWHSYGRLQPEPGKTLYASIWTIHPIVSIVYIPDKESFSRRCRIALLFVTLMVQMVVECIAFRVQGYYKGRNILSFAILGIIFSIPATYAVGFFFRMYSKRANENERLMHYDVTAMVRYRRIFKLATLSTLGVGVLLLYWQVIYLVGILATEWILCFIVGVGIDLCILDFAAVFLSMKYEKIGNILKLRGYYFDGDISFYNIL